MRTKIYAAMVVLACLCVLSVWAQPKEANEAGAGVTAVEAGSGPFESDIDKVSYSIGAQIGQNFKRDELQINIDILVRGMRDAMAGRELALSDQQMREVMMSFQQRMRQQREERQKIEGAKNLAAGTAFLEANAKKEGVKALASGLQYKVIKDGTGKTPTATDRVKTNYRGRLIDGTEFDSSYKRGEPAQFAVRGVIKGWTEALQLMKEGAKWELYVPANLAYGERGRPSIPPNSTLIFEIELLEVVAGPPMPPKAGPPPGVAPRTKLPPPPRKK